VIPAIELAEATAELHADYHGTPESADWVVVCNGYPRRFHSNLCGYQASAVTLKEATHFDSIHEAGAACRAARLTGIITIDPVAVPQLQSAHQTEAA
jgi:hypothetical protein